MSKPSQRRPDLAAEPSRPTIEAAQEWQAHVDAGRIGQRNAPTPAQLLRHMRNEEVLLGQPRSVKVRVREDLRGRG